MTSRSNIPESAVEAVASIIYRTSGRRRVMGYAHARDACESEARELLEAAAPHLMAGAWDEGERTGRSRAMRHMSDEPNLPLVASNPYKAAK